MHPVVSPVSLMTTLCFNSVENDPFIKKGLSQEELLVRQTIQQIRAYGVEDKYIFKVGASRARQKLEHSSELWHSSVYIYYIVVQQQQPGHV